MEVDSKGRLHLLYFKGEPRAGDIFYVRSDDGGRTFTKPLQVNSQPKSVVIMGTIRGPHLAIGKGDRIHVAWMGSYLAEPKLAGKSAPMLYTRSNSAGDAFEPQRNVIQTHPGLDGGGAVAADPEGNVYVAWHAPRGAQDKTGTDHDPQHGHGSPPGESGHRAPRGHGGHDEADRQVWVTRSRDEGVTFGPEVAAVPKQTGVCGCCGLNIVAGEKGQVWVIFRSATEKVHRDIHVLHSTDYGGSFDIAAVDPWNVGKCVMSTAGFAKGDGKMYASWETQEQVRLATLDGGAAGARQPFSMPGDAKSRKHPRVAVNNGGEVIVAWVEGAGWTKGGDVVWQAMDAEGQPITDVAGRQPGLPAFGVPATFANRDGSFTVIY